MSEEREYLYRYEDQRYAPPLDEFDNPMGEGSIRVHLRKYRIFKRTPCGAWIVNKYLLCSYGRELSLGDCRFVNLQARKRFACPTVEEAKESFIARKNRQIRILNSQLSWAKKALNIINNERLL